MITIVDGIISHPLPRNKCVVCDYCKARITNDHKLIRGNKVFTDWYLLQNVKQDSRQYDFCSAECVIKYLKDMK